MAGWEDGGSAGEGHGNEIIASLDYSSLVGGRSLEDGYGSLSPDSDMAGQYKNGGRCLAACGEGEEGLCLRTHDTAGGMRPCPVPGGQPGTFTYVGIAPRPEWTIVHIGMLLKPSVFVCADCLRGVCLAAAGLATATASISVDEIRCWRKLRRSSLRSGSYPGGLPALPKACCCCYKPYHHFWERI